LGGIMAGDFWWEWTWQGGKNPSPAKEAVSSHIEGRGKKGPVLPEVGKGKKEKKSKNGVWASSTQWGGGQGTTAERGKKKKKDILGKSQ